MNFRSTNEQSQPTNTDIPVIFHPDDESPIPRSLPAPDEVAESTIVRTEGTSAAFIKELVRRGAQFCFERGGDGTLTSADIDAALDELLFAGGSLNRSILGAERNEV